MDTIATEDEPCEQCGLCCRIFGPGIAPTTANVYSWIEQERTDILRWFVAFMENGSTPVTCIDLKAEDLGSVVSFVMRNPSHGSGERHILTNAKVSKNVRNQRTSLTRMLSFFRNIF